MTGKPRSCTREGCEQPTIARRLCRKHYQAAWHAGEFENAPLPPRTPGKTICPIDHKHADSSTCYIQHQCRCVPCKEHHSAMEQRRKMLKAYGRFDTGLVDAGPVRDHMAMLAEYGLGYKRVAALAGLGITPVRNIIWGRQDPGPRHGELPQRVKRETAAAILTITPELENLAAGAHVPAVGTHRRLQALVAIGWSLNKLAERLHMERSNLGVLLQRDHVTVRVHQQVSELFERLWNTPPAHEEWREKIAHSRALNYAHEHHWLPPMAWDDIDTDPEPPAPDTDGTIDQVDEIAIDLAAHGERVRLSVLERRETIRRLHALHLSDGEIAKRIQVTARSVLRIREEMGLPAVVDAGGRVIAA